MTHSAWLAGIVIATLVAGCGGNAPQEPGGSVPNTAAAANFSEFPLYYAGASISDLPLSSAGEDDVEDVRRGSSGRVIFLYGDCDPQDPSGDSSCSSPVEIDNQRLCDDYPARIGTAEDIRLVRVAGTTAAIYESRDSTGTHFGKLQLFSDKTSVTILANNEALARIVAGALRQVNGRHPGQPVTPYDGRIIAGRPSTCP